MGWNNTSYTFESYQNRNMSPGEQPLDSRSYNQKPEVPRSLEVYHKTGNGYQTDVMRGPCHSSDLMLRHLYFQAQQEYWQKQYTDRVFPLPGHDVVQYTRQRCDQTPVSQMRNPYLLQSGVGPQGIPMNPYQPYHQLPPSILPPHLPDADLDRGVRSPLLHEFRNDVKGTRRYELRVSIPFCQES